MISYVVACVYVYKIAFGLTRARIAAIGGLLVFRALNPESPVYAVHADDYSCFSLQPQRWFTTSSSGSRPMSTPKKYPYLFAASLAAFFACLTRYEAWAMAVVMGVIVLFVAWRQNGRQAVEGVSLAFACLAGAAIVLWLGWNLVTSVNRSNFRNGRRGCLVLSTRRSC